MESLQGRIGTTPADPMCGYVDVDIGSKLCSVEPRHQADSSFDIAEIGQYLSVRLAESLCNEAHHQHSIAHPVARRRHSEGYARLARSGSGRGRIPQHVAVLLSTQWLGLPLQDFMDNGSDRIPSSAYYGNR